MRGKVKTVWAMQELVWSQWHANQNAKRCLWTMHSPQAPTMLDFDIIIRNVVWIKIKFCKINDILRARGRQEGQGKITLGHAGTCGVTMACKSKWQKMPMDHAQVTSTNNFDFDIIMRNAVWVKVKFCKINDLLRARERQEGQGKITPHHTTTQPQLIPHHTHTTKPLL